MSLNLIENMFTQIKVSVLALMLTMLFANAVVAQQVYKGSFEQLKAFGNVEIELVETTDEERVEVIQADDEEILVSFDLKNLNVKTKSLIVAKTRKRAVVKVYFKELSRIISSGGAEVFSNADIKNTELRIEVHSGASYESVVSANKLLVVASEGGLMALLGEVKNLDILVSTGANINAKELESTVVTAKANTGGILNIKSPANFTVKASTGGEVNYVGALQTHSFKESLGGKILNK